LPSLLPPDLEERLADEPAGVAPEQPQRRGVREGTPAPAIDGDDALVRRLDEQPKILDRGLEQLFAVHATARSRGRGRSRGRSTGRWMRKVVPTPSRLSSSMAPPCASTIAFAIPSPSPVPGIARFVAAEERKKRSNSRVCSSAGMPIPLSRTSSTA